jgi:DNA-binding HxlR family transcriptional regulator
MRLSVARYTCNMQVSHAGADARQRERRSNCPVACSLDVIGDRWTLLIIRDLLQGKSRYSDFLTSAEGIPTNILAERLRRLEHAGIIASAQYGTHSRRKQYQLTEAGNALAPALRALRDWGLSQFPGTHAPG